MKKILFTCLSILFSFSLIAQGKSKLELTLTLRDGNVITGTNQKISNVVLTTSYGKLDIPIKNISTIQIGIDADKANAEKIKNLCKQLANSSENMRSNAFEELIKMPLGAIPVIDEFMFSAAAPVSEFADYTIESVLSNLKSAHGINENYTADDVVSIDYSYTMGGKYEFKDIELKTEYGTLNIPKSKIEKIDVLYTGDSEGQKTFKLMASKHISSNASGGWLKTGITVKPGQKMQLTATGEVTLASLSNNKYKPNGKVVGASTTEYDDYGYDDAGGNYPTYGQVVFKIGENGTVTKAGSSYNAPVKSSGALYISIYETVYNAVNSGMYVVNINIK